MKMSFSSSMKINKETRGDSIDPDQQEIVKKLISIAYELQRRFTLAEKSLLTFCELIDNKLLYSSIEQTYEAHVIETLRIQLFRVLIVDLWGCVFDDDNRTGSVRSILKKLRRCSCALNALKAYHSDTECLDISFHGNISKEEKADQIERLKKQHIEEQIGVIDREWDSIDSGSDLLDNVEAKRLKWLRHKIIVHYEKTDSGLHVYNDIPPDGDGPITWMEPVLYFRSVREYVYKVFSLITSTSWDTKATDIHRFYSKAFWDRFINGRTELKPTGIMD